MEILINSNECVYKEFERIKGHLNKFEMQKNNITVTISYYGHIQKEKRIYKFTNKQYYNLFCGLLTEHKLSQIHEKDYNKERT